MDKEHRLLMREDIMNGFNPVLKELFSDMDDEKIKTVDEGLEIIYNCFRNDKLPTEMPNFDLVTLIPAVWAWTKSEVDIDTFIKHFTVDDFEAELGYLLADGIRYNYKENKNSYDSN